MGPLIERRCGRQHGALTKQVLRGNDGSPVISSSLGHLQVMQSLPSKIKLSTFLSLLEQTLGRSASNTARADASDMD